MKTFNNSRYPILVQIDDINVVMEQQKELVEIVSKLNPIDVVKG